jgi:tetrahydromethanopterin S-methyltransferase subunit D
MKRKRSLLQKSALVCAMLSFGLAAVCIGLLIYGVGGPGFRDPVSASLMASVFFCICVGIVLAVIGTSDLPSFRFEPPRDGDSG